MAKRKVASAAAPATTTEPIVADPPRRNGLLFAVSAILWCVWLLFLISLALNR